VAVTIKINGSSSYESTRARINKERDFKERSRINEKKVFKISNFLGGQD